MVSLLKCSSTSPLLGEENDSENADIVIVEDQNHKLRNQQGLEYIDGSDDMETAQSYFRPLFVYRKLSQQRYPANRRSKSVLRRRQVPRYAYYY